MMEAPDVSIASYRSDIARAAQLVGIDIGSIGGFEHPWNTEHPQKREWRMALAEIAPQFTQRMEARHGKPLSMALELALSGEREWTEPLLAELQEKRPWDHRQQQQQAMEAQINAMTQATAELAERNNPHRLRDQQRKQEDARRQAARRQVVIR